MKSKTQHSESNSRRHLMPRHRSCKERLTENLKGRMASLRAVWRAYQNGEEDDDSGQGRFCEYGYGFDYVRPSPGAKCREPYFRYLLSGGGPSDEIRFFANQTGRGWKLYRVEYWFMDWCDGARRVLKGQRLALLAEIFGWFDEGSATERAHRQALED